MSSFVTERYHTSSQRLRSSQPASYGVKISCDDLAKAAWSGINPSKKKESTSAECVQAVQAQRPQNHMDDMNP